MKYVKMTISYLKNNFWRLFLTLVPASLICALVLKPLTSATALYYMTKEQTHNPKDLINSLDFASEWYYIFIYLGVIVFLSVFISYAYITVYRHLSTGKISIRTPFRYINGVFIPVAKLLLLMGIFIVVLQFVLSGLLYLFNYTFSAISLPYEVFLVVAYILIIACLIFGGFMIKTPLMAMFHMYVYGYGIAEAWNANAKLLDKKMSVTIFFATFPLFLIIIALNYVFLFLTVAPWLEVIIRTAVYFFIFAYAITLSIMIMFDLCGLQRRDIPAHRR